MRALLLITLLPAAALAQLSTITPGTRVRGVIPVLIPEQITATFVSATTDSVWLRDAGGRRTTGRMYHAPRLALHHSQITALEASLGRNHRRGARNGLLTGLAGTIVFFGIGAAENSEFSAVLAVGASMIFLPLATIAGAVIGAEDWRRVIPPSKP